MQRPYYFTEKAIIAISDFDMEEAKKAGHNLSDDTYHCDVHFEVSNGKIKIVGLDNQVLVDKD